MSGTSRNPRTLKSFTGVVAVLLALAVSLVFNIQAPAHASGNPPTSVLPAPAGGVNTLHGAHPGFKRGVSRTRPASAKAAIPNGVSNPVYGTDPIIMVHGINGGSSGSSGNGGGGISCTAGLWGPTRTYLQGWHPGLGQDYINWTGGLYLVGFYNGDWNCSSNAYISTNNNPHGNYGGAQACDGIVPVGWYGGYSNNSSSVGTNNEPIEHIACELSW